MNRYDFENRYSYEFIKNTRKAMLFDKFVTTSYNSYKKPFVAVVDLTIVDAGCCIVEFKGKSYRTCIELSKAINSYNSLQLFHSSLYYPILTPLEAVEGKITYYLTKVLGLTQCKSNTTSEVGIINKRTFYVKGPWSNSDFITYVRIRYDGIIESDENKTSGTVIISLGGDKSFSQEFKNVEEAIASVQTLLQIKFVGAMSRMLEVLSKFDNSFENVNAISGNDFADVMYPISFNANHAILEKIEELRKIVVDYVDLSPTE